MSQSEQRIYIEWPHSPPHLFVSGASYFITGGTYLKARLFDAPRRRDLLLATICQQAGVFGWMLEAWAVMSNHYHLVARAPEDAKTLTAMLRATNSITARAINAEDQTPGRKVWFQFRDTCLTYEKSWLARLAYVHSNPVKHGMVNAAENYPWCSMGWLLRRGNSGFSHALLKVKWDRISVDDDF